MKTKFNFWAFIFSFLCIALFFMPAFQAGFTQFVISTFHIHPLNIVLIMSILTFLFGVIGFIGVNSTKSLMRSIFTITITFALSAITALILVMAKFMPFT